MTDEVKEPAAGACGGPVSKQKGHLDNPRDQRGQATPHAAKEIISAHFPPVGEPRDEQLERAKETWRSLNREKTLVALPKIPDNYVENVYESPLDGCTQKAYQAAHDETTRNLQDGGAKQLGVINAITLFAEVVGYETKAKPTLRKQRRWQKNSEE